MSFKTNWDERNDQRARLSQFYFDSDEDDFGGFSPVETNIEELYPSVSKSCAGEQCAALCYITLLFLLSGGAASLGVFVFIWGITQDSNHRMLVELVASIQAICISVSGVVAIVVSTLGCVGTVKRSSKVLRVTALFLKLLVLFEIAASLVGFVYQGKVENETKKLADWKSFIQHYHEDPNLRSTVDLIQRRLKCCGFESFKDWEVNPLFSCYSADLQTCNLPTSCCKATRNKRGCSYSIFGDSDRENSVYSEGCLNRIQDWSKYNLLFISIAFLFLVVPQVVVIILVRRHLRHLSFQDTEDSSQRSETEMSTTFRDFDGQAFISKDSKLRGILVRNPRVTMQRTRRAVLNGICGYWIRGNLKKDEFV